MSCHVNAHASSSLKGFLPSDCPFAAPTTINCILYSRVMCLRMLPNHLSRKPCGYVKGKQWGWVSPGASVSVSTLNNNTWFLKPGTVKHLPKGSVVNYKNSANRSLSKCKIYAATIHFCEMLTVLRLAATAEWAENCCPIRNNARQSTGYPLPFSTSILLLRLLHEIMTSYHVKE